MHIIYYENPLKAIFFFHSYLLKAILFSTLFYSRNFCCCTHTYLYTQMYTLTYTVLKTFLQIHLFMWVSVYIEFLMDIHPLLVYWP